MSRGNAPVSWSGYMPTTGWEASKEDMERFFEELARQVAWHFPPDSLERLRAEEAEQLKNLPPGTCLY